MIFSGQFQQHGRAGITESGVTAMPQQLSLTGESGDLTGLVQRENMGLVPAIARLLEDATLLFVGLQ